LLWDDPPYHQRRNLAPSGNLSHSNTTQEGERFWASIPSTLKGDKESAPTLPDYDSKLHHPDYGVNPQKLM